MISKMGILPANRISVNEAGYTLPRVQTTLYGWFQRLVLTIVNKSIKDYEVVEVQRKLECLGVIQPFSARELKVKPEGERSWAGRCCTRRSTWTSAPTTSSMSAPRATA